MTDKTEDALDALIPPHPEPHSHRWSELERAAIREALHRQHQRIEELEKALQATYDALQTSYPLHSCDMEKRFVIMSQARALLSTTQQEDSQS